MSLNFSADRGLHFVHLNVRSLWSKYDQIRQLLYNSNISLMGISESWLSTHVDQSLIEIPNYSCIRLDRNWSDNTVHVKKGGGVCCYIKNDMIYSENEFSNLNVSSKNIEVQIFSINQPHLKKIIILNLYRPPQGNTTTFCETLYDITVSLKITVKNEFELFILGDFNIDYSNQTSPGYKDVKWLEQRLGLQQLINLPTRYSHVNTCIDLVFTDCKHVMKSGVANVNISDHQAIFITRKHTTKTKIKSEFTGRSYINFDEELFCENLVQYDWDHLYEIDDVDIAWNLFISHIIETIDNMCPLKKFKIKNLKDPWISNEILESIHDKDILLRQAKRTGLENDWKLAKNARNRLNLDIKNIKAEFIQENLEIHQGDPKKFWKDVQIILPKKGKSNFRNYILKNDLNEPIYDPKIAANFLNSYFVNVGPKLAERFACRWNFRGTETMETLNNITVHEDEVIKLCKEININKSSAIENISSKVLKLALIKFSKQFTYIINLTFQNSTIPELWKIASVTPLFKSGNVSKCNNYRPISQLPLPGKIVEKIVHQRMSTFFEINKILNENQGGFRKNQSTTNTSAKFLDTIYNSINTKNISIATYIDFSKAFDTVSHDILIKKLKLYGIKHKNLEWIQNYLNKRKQKTIFNNASSELNDITVGVPQGSVLGPLLFLVYINDLCDVLETSHSFLYADDTVLVSSASDYIIAHRDMQHDLDNITNWCKSNKLTLNISKTKCMLLGSKHKIRKTRHFPLHIDNIPLDYVLFYKYLGITTDQSLNVNLHVNQLIKTISYKLSLLQKLKCYISCEAAIQIYKSMVIPYFDYGDVLYQGTNKKHLDKLQKLQNRGLRICFGHRNQLSIDNMHFEAKICKLQDRRNQHVYNFMFKQKCNHNIVDTRNIRTRAHDAILFNTNMPLCEKFKHNIFYYGARLWNQLPVKERKIEEYKTFKNVQKSKNIV